MRGHFGGFGAASIVALASTLATASANATHQIPDKLLYKGATHDLYVHPLEHHPRRTKYPKRAPTTACWRGYNAEWEIKNGELWLRSVRDCFGDDDIPVGPIAPGLKLNTRASWYTGNLLSPMGRSVDAPDAEDEYDDSDGGTERQLRILIVRGKAVAERIVDARPRPKRAAPPLVPPEIEAALKRPRELLRHCAGMPRQLRAEVEVWTHGAPRSVVLRDKVSRAVQTCVIAAVWVAGEFPARGQAYKVRLTIVK